MQSISAKIGLISGLIELARNLQFFLLIQMGNFDTLASSISYP